MRLRWKGIRDTTQTAAPLSNPTLESGTETVSCCANFVLIAGVVVYVLTLVADHSARGRRGGKKALKKARQQGIGKIFIHDFSQYSCGFSGILAPGHGAGACKARRGLLQQ